MLERDGVYRKYKYVGRLPLASEWKKGAGKRSLIKDKTYELDKKKC